ncbi:DMT family transporter [bacterium]|nr:DMT family transporter [bacterium]
MISHEQTLFYALGANLAFAFACLIFTEYSRKVSTLWMNAFKATVAFSAFGLAALVGSGFSPIEWPAFTSLFVSGFIGLGIGDLFLLRAFSIIGAGRTLVLFAFQPLILGTFSFYLFDQAIDYEKFWGLLFFLACLFIFSFEAKKTTGHWEIKGLAWALIAVSFDAMGVLMTRWAFDQTPEMNSNSANFYRTIGCLFAFFLISRFYRPLELWGKFKTWPIKVKSLILTGCLCGTYLSLLLYLTALKSGHLATVSGIAITSPLFATLFESIWHKRWPTKYLWAALCSFVIGFYIVL